MFEHRYHAVGNLALIHAHVLFFVAEFFKTWTSWKGVRRRGYWGPIWNGKISGQKGHQGHRCQIQVSIRYFIYKDPDFAFTVN